MRKKSTYFALFFTVSVIFLSGCTDMFLNPSNGSSSSSKLAVKIDKPLANDTVAYVGTDISYEVSSDMGIYAVELYINGTINKWTPANGDGSKPTIPLLLDSTYIGSRISYFLIYYDKDGASARSDTVKNILITGVPPNTPYNFSLLRVDGNVLNLSWKDSTIADQTGYEIWRKRGFYGGYVLKLVAPPGIYNINDDDASDTTVYYYKIRSLNKYGTSDFSYEINTYGDGAVHSIAPPTALKAVAIGPTEIILSWNDDVSGENYFKIERRYTWSNFTTAGISNKNSTQFADSANGLTPSTGYYYRVKAISGRDSSWSNEIYIETPSQ